MVETSGGGACNAWCKMARDKVRKGCDCEKVFGRDEWRMREEMQLRVRGRTYHACVTHFACGNWKLCLSSWSCFCNL